MILKCIQLTNDDYDLFTLNKKYTVFAIEIREDGIKYIICDDEGKFVYTIDNHFEIVDSRFSYFWKICKVNSSCIYLVHKNWENCERFSNEILYFADKNQEWCKKDIKEMEEEFTFYDKCDIYQDENIDIKASILDDNWVMCPKCDEVWELNSKLGVTSCPSCKISMNNPFAKEKIKNNGVR